MRQSKYFLKTSKTVSEEDNIISSKLLKQACYIRESVAGRYFILPIGQKVQQKIMSIIKDEMDKVGAQEMLSPILHPLELWKETNRTNTTGFELMKVKDRRDAEFALGGTAEEMFVDIVRKFKISYKDLPFHIYQFSPKFRDELRARGGLLRVREFIMKDGYSFDKNEEEFKKTYEEMKKVYSRIFDRMNLKTDVVESDNGYIGGEYCHEFIVPSEIGESRYFSTEDGSYSAHEDIAKFKRNPVNIGEKLLPFEIIEQPKWVQTMEDNVKHYKKDKSNFLKNVVYKNRVTGEIVIAVLTGDLEVNQTKLEQVIKAVGQLAPAEDSDLVAFGTKRGYVHCWGHNGVRYIGDTTLKQARNLIGGQKEDTTDSINVNYNRDFTCEMLADIGMAKPGDLSEDGKVLIEKRGIEVGNIFQLGYHYTKLMAGANFTDFDGTDKPYYMGCYGIGVGRTMATAVEKFNDDKGIIWPESIAPFKIHLLLLGEDETVLKEANNVYESLQKAGIEVLFDDRSGVSPGEKFSDADLIGIPMRAVVSVRSMKENGIELKGRTEEKGKIVTLDELIKLTSQLDKKL